MAQNAVKPAGTLSQPITSTVANQKANSTNLLNDLALEIAPSLPWIMLVIFFIVLIGPSRMRRGFDKATRIGIVGLEVEFGSEIKELAEAKQIAMPDTLRDQVADRMNRLQHLFQDARILWIDDKPIGNSSEIKLLRKLGAQIDLASSDEEARIQLSRGVYDIVISDIQRFDQPEAGLLFAPEVLASPFGPELIFYTGKDGVAPDGAFGLTNKPGELFNLTMDALERRA